MAVAVKVIVRPAVGLVGLKVKSIVGAVSTVTSREADAFTPRVSVAVTVAVNEPALP
jgi:hypothetical protein